MIYYEAPHRIAETLAAAMSVFGGERRAVIGRELTKRFETVLDGTLAELHDGQGQPYFPCTDRRHDEVDKVNKDSHISHAQTKGMMKRRSGPPIGCHDRGGRSSQCQHAQTPAAPNFLGVAISQLSRTASSRSPGP